MKDEGGGVEMILHSASEEETFSIGRRLGAALSGGELIVLSGDLGAGKTRLAAGIAAGMDVEGDVSSPTFVLERIHPGRPPLHHLDLYRVTAADDLDGLEIEASLLAGHVVVVEWGEKIAAADRVDAITIRIDFSGGEESGSTRILRLSGPVPAGLVGIDR